MGLRNLFRRVKSQPSPKTNESATRSALTSAIDNAIMSMMLMNLAMMGVKPQQVPTDGTTGSLRSRGYLIGLTEAVLQQFASLRPTEAEFVSSLASAFAFTYGRCDWNWALDALDAFQRDEPDAVDGAKLGRRDVLAIYNSEPFAAATGFWLLNSGDEEAIRLSLATL